MLCGNIKHPVKSWDRHKDIMVVKPSRYETNEASVRVHWKNVINELEASYKDDKFWETQTETVRELVGPEIFERLVKIFELQIKEIPYEPQSESSVVVPSEEFYRGYVSKSQLEHKPTKSILSFASDIDIEEEEEEEESVVWTESTEPSLEKELSNIKHRSKSGVFKTKTKSALSVKSKSKVDISTLGMSRSIIESTAAIKLSEFDASSAFTEDDIIVNTPSASKIKPKKLLNPHFEMLYCSQSENDMVKWKSNMYTKKKLSSKSALDLQDKEIATYTLEICEKFFAWWTSIGSADYKSDIKKPEDIESLFQIWFDEHASRGMVLDPKVIPCVLQSIADYVRKPECSCYSMHKRQLAWDMHAETCPAHTRAFNTSLPREKRHIPPKNRTAEKWGPVKVPEDLKTMAAVYEDISHLTCTKSFTKWLHQHPHFDIPSFLKMEHKPDSKHPFAVPSDLVIGDNTTPRDMVIPVSKHNIEIKAVVSELLRD